MLRLAPGFTAAVCIALPAFASAQFVLPPLTMTVTGVPPITVELVQKAAPYTSFRPSSIVAWHPTTSAMLIQTQHGETAQLHLLAAPGEKPVVITDAANEVDGAWFHPRAVETILLRRDTNGDRRFRLFMFDLATQRITPVSSDRAAAGVPDWNNKGDRVVFTGTNFADANAGTKKVVMTDVLVVDPLNPDRVKRIVTLPGGRWSDVRFSPDQKSLVILETVSADGSHIWRINIATGKRARLTAQQNRLPVSYAALQFGTDGKRLFATSRNAGSVRRLVEIDLASGRQTALTSHLSVDVDEFSVSVAARRIAFITNDNGVSVLRFLDLDSKKELPRPALLAGEISGLQWRSENAGNILGFHLSSPKSPREVFSYDVKTTKLTRWTNGAAAGLNPFDFVEPKTVMLKRDDGSASRCLLYLPDAMKFSGRRPVVIKMHDPSARRLRVGFIGRENYFINETGVAIFECEDRRPDDVTAWIAAQPDLDGDRFVWMDVAGGMVVEHNDKLPANGIVNPTNIPVLVVGNDIGGDASGNTPTTIASPRQESAAKKGQPVWLLVAREQRRIMAEKSNQDFVFFVQVRFLSALLAGK